MFLVIFFYLLLKDDTNQLESFMLENMFKVNWFAKLCLLFWNKWNLSCLLNLSCATSCGHPGCLQQTPQRNVSGKEEA